MSNESHLHAGQAADTHPTDAARGPGYEVRDTNVWAVLKFIIALGLFIVVCQVALWGLLKSIRGDRTEAFDPKTTLAVEDDRRAVKLDLTAQRHELRAFEENVLAGKQPAGRNSGKTVIPIDRAIELLAERGVPPIPGPAKTQAEVNAHAGSPAPDAQKKGAAAEKGQGGSK